MLTRQKIVFVLRTYKEILVFRSMIRALARRGHALTVLFDPHLSKDFSITEIRNEERGYAGGVVYDWACPALRRGTALFHTRELLSFRRYLLRQEQSRFYEERWRRYLHPKLQQALSVPGVVALLKTRMMGVALRGFERAHSAQKNILLHLRELNPDLIMCSPVNMRFSSADLEYLKAAASLGFPTVIPVLTWDNLATKGVFHIVPERIFVWSDAQADEAVLHHGVPREQIVVSGSPFFDHWFAHLTPSLSRKEFCLRYGLREADPLITYLGSSVNMAKDESWFLYELRKMLDAASDPRLTRSQIILRPHPTHHKIYEKLAIRDLVVLPKNGALLDSQENTQLFFDTLIFSFAALQGVNTSAMIDAMIVGIPGVTVMNEKYRRTQAETQHFQQLVKEDAIPFVRSQSELSDILRKLLDGKDEYREKRNHFVEHYIRPRGIEIPVGEVMADEIEKFLTGRHHP